MSAQPNPIVKFQEVELPDGRVFEVPSNWGDFQIETWFKQGAPRGNYVRQVVDRPEAAKSSIAFQEMKERPGTATRTAGLLGEAARSAPELVEDIAYPALGAMGGAAAGSVGGPPGVAAGAFLGGAAGEAYKQNVRHARRAMGSEERLPSSSLEAANELAMGGFGGLIQEIPAQVARRTASQGLLSGMNKAERAAIEEGVSLTKGQAGGRISKAVEGGLESFLPSRPVFRELKTGTQLPQVEKSFDRLLNSISKANLSPEVAGEYTAAAIRTGRKRAGELFGKVEDEIASALPKLTVPQKGALAKDARDMINELTTVTVQHKNIRKFAGQDINKAIALLSDFTKQDVQIPIKDAIELRKLLFKLGESDEVASIGEAAIQRITKSLHNAVGDSLVNAGRPDLLQKFRNASTQFRQTMNRFESPSVQRILKSAADKPEVVADIFLGKGSLSVSRKVAALVTPKQAPVIFRNVVGQMLENATVEGIPVSQKFASIKNRIGDKALAQMLGSPQNVRRFENIVTLMDRIGFTDALAKPDVGGAGTAMLGGMAATAGGAAMRFSPAIGGSVATLGAAVVGPNLLARWMTRGRNLVTLENMLKDAAKSANRREAIGRILGLVGSEQAKENTRELGISINEPQERKKLERAKKNEGLLNAR